MIIQDHVLLLQSKIAELEERIEKHKHYERINAALFHISHAVNTSSSIDELFGGIHWALSLIIELDSFFIALCDPIQRTIHFPFLIDTTYKGKSPVLSMDNPASLTAEVIRRKVPILMTQSEIEAFRKCPEAAEIPFPNAAIWLGVPLFTQQEVFGVVGVLSYQNDAQYDLRDLDVMVYVADQISFAIQHTRTKERLRENEERLRLITDNTSSFIGVVNTEGVYEYANPAHRNLGYEPKELIGRSGIFMIHPDDRKLVLGVLQQGIAGELSRAKLTYRSIGKDGRIYDIEGTFDSIRDRDGKLHKIVFVTDDVTEWNAVQREAAKQAEMLSMVLEATGAGIWEWNIKTGTFWLNERAAEILGYTVDQLKPFDIEKWLSLCHPEDIAHAQTILKTHFREEQPFFIHECRVKHRDGHWIWVETRGRVVERDEAGKPLRMMGIKIDITQRKRAEEERKQIEAVNYQLQKAESLGRMAAAIAHRFNNQLHVVMGNLQMGIDDVPEGTETRIILKEAYEAAKRAATVSGMMLTYLGHKAGGKQRVDLSAEIRKNLSLLEAMAPRGVHIEAYLPVQDGPILYANAELLQQMLTNLVVNAWEAGAEEPYPIRITLQTIGGERISPESVWYPADWKPSLQPYACISVVDSGGGIPKEHMNRLFDPFFTTKALGRGMGLAVVLGIVQGHEGGITIRSQPGKGTMMNVFLPLAEHS